MTRNEYLPGVDGLRGIAVLSVLFFHTGFDQWFSGGYVGVDIFFVISGFLITRLIAEEIQESHNFNFSNFYYRRCKRIFPALFFVFLLSFIFAFLLFTPQHFERFGGELSYALLSLSNFFFWNESGYFNTDSSFKPLLHTWSLSVEEQFYLLWPIVLVFFLKNTSKMVLFIFIALSIIFSLLINFVMSDGHSSLLSEVVPKLATLFSDGPSTIFYLAPFRVFEFAIGALLVWIYKYQPKHNTTLELLMGTGLIMVIFSISVFDETIIFPSYNGLIPCVGTFLIIFSSNARYSGFFVRNKVIIAIGLISYSVYLIHWPILVFYQYYKMLPLTLVEQLVIIVMSLLTGMLMYRFIEKPFRNHSPNNSNFSKAGFGLTSALVSIILILPAATVWANSGWPWRIKDIPDKIAQQLKDSKAFHVDNYGGEGFPYAGWIREEGQNGKVDIVLLGDSHARQYAYGLDKHLVRQEKKNIYISSTSCLLLPGAIRSTPGTDWEKVCTEHISKAVETLKENPDAILMIAHLWDFQVSVAVNQSNGEPIGSYENILPLFDKLKDMIGNHQLIIVGNVPGAGVRDLMSCFSRPSYFPGNCNNFLTRSEDEIETISGNNILKDYAKNKEGVEFIDTHEAFCSKGVCRSIFNGQVLYSDGSHLSKNGSSYFVEHFKSYLLKLAN